MDLPLKTDDHSAPNGEAEKEEIMPTELNDFEALAINKLWKKRQAYCYENAIKNNYYHGLNRVRDLGIAIPPQLRNVQQGIGWPRIAVDALAKRIELGGWTDPENIGLNEIFDANHLLTESKKAHLDSFKFGVAYVVVGHGDTSIGEPEVLITVENPDFCVANFNIRKRRVSDAILLQEEGDGLYYGTYLTETETIPFLVKNGKVLNNPYEDRTEHGFGRVPVVQIINRSETGTFKGHSEITEPIRSITNSMARTMLGAEVAREFYSAPQRYILGADNEMFVDADGNQRDSLSVSMDRVLALPGGGMNGEILPQVGQFQANSPAPFIDSMKYYAQLFASYAEIPEHYIGFNSVNPTSADAIRASESSLIKKTQDRIDEFMRPWMEVATLAIMARDGVIPEGFKPTPIFRNPATISSSAAADEVIKLVGSGILRPDSEMVYRILGFSRAQIETIRAENNTQGAKSLIESLRASATTATDTATDNAATAPTEV
jgi:hypothetical protein